MLRFLLLLACFLSLVAVAPGAFVPPSVSFSDLSLPSAASSAVFSSSLREVGLLSVEGIPNFSQLRKRILLAASQCALYSKGDANSFQYVFPDGTVRHTLATKTEHNEQAKVQGVEAENTLVCQRFNALQIQFRTVVNEVGKLFIQRLDELQENGFGSKLILNGETNSYFDSFQEIVSNGVELEHFHTYEKVTSSETEEKEEEGEEVLQFTLDVHIDQGLFIAIVPAMILNTEEEERSGFFVQLSSGEVVETDFGNGDKIVFMLGDSVTKYLNAKLKFPLRSVPHAMNMPKLESFSDKVSIIRSWYGRMYLLPKSSFLESLEITFGEVQSAYSDRKLLKEMSLSVCSDNFILEKRQLQAVCSDNEIRCWASCVPELTCSSSNETTQCLLESSEGAFTICDGETHNPNCEATCAFFELESVDIGNDFCNGFKVSMFMDGFTGFGKNTQCLVFLFQPFVLDSKLKFVLASLVTFVICMFIEFVVSLRRRVGKTKPKTQERLKQKQVFQVLLYSVQITFGYIAMLLAMTYSVVLFLMVVLGLTFGHVLFNFKNQKAAEFSEHCCPTPEDEEDIQKNNGKVLKAVELTDVQQQQTVVI